MSYEIGYSQEHPDSIEAGHGAAQTSGGSLNGVQQQGTGTGEDALVAPATDEPITSTSPDLANPESNTQYNQRDLGGRLPAKGIYARPNVWSDVLYWMDS
jgi:hypothetical protein